MTERFTDAQIALNEQIVADCDPLVPFRQGQLKNSVRFPEGIAGGLIEWNTPYAHYMYMGEVYGPNIPIRDEEGNVTGFYSPPEKYPTDRPLTYHTPGTTGKWFDAAKARHLQQWVKLVEDRLKG